MDSLIFTEWVLVLLVVISILVVVSIQTDVKENFQNNSNMSNEFQLCRNCNDIYDGFYANIYDDLVYNPHKNKFEINSIVQSTNLGNSSSVLEIGCGTGHHAAEISKVAESVVACDISKHMIRKCQQTYKYPNLTFIQGNALDTLLFQPMMFSHIMCMYFTIYYLEDKNLFFYNCHQWLKHKGFLVVHLVDREKFDPVIPLSSPFMFVNPQNHAKSRITKSTVYFKDFKYTSSFNFDKNKKQTEFSENFQNRSTNKIFRKNEHIFYMEPESEIISIASKQGFNVTTKIDLLKTGYEHQYVYVFMKK